MFCIYMVLFESLWTTQKCFWPNGFALIYACTDGRPNLTGCQQIINNSYTHSYNDGVSSGASWASVSCSKRLNTLTTRFGIEPLEKRSTIRAQGCFDGLTCTDASCWISIDEVQAKLAVACLHSRKHLCYLCYKCHTAGYIAEVWLP